MLPRLFDHEKSVVKVSVKKVDLDGRTVYLLPSPTKTNIKSNQFNKTPKKTNTFFEK